MILVIYFISYGIIITLFYNLIIKKKGIKELLDADPDPEIIAEELKKVMNLIFKQLKKQIKSEEYYAGNGILSAMLKIIKMYTLRILQSNNDDDENEQDIDYFSQHIYKAPELTQSVNINWQPLQTERQASQQNSIQVKIHYLSL
jgi:hypothetical protein